MYKQAIRWVPRKYKNLAAQGEKNYFISLFPGFKENNTALVTFKLQWK